MGFNNMQGKAFRRRYNMGWTYCRPCEIWYPDGTKYCKECHRRTSYTVHAKTRSPQEKEIRDRLRI